MRLIDLLIPKPKHPQVPNLREGKDDNLHLASLTRGGLVIGRPGSGKTVWEVMQTMRRALAQPSDPIFVLDASGSFTDEFIKLSSRLNPSDKASIEERLVYDRLGDPEWVVPFPFFSSDYGLDMEEQIQRVKDLFINLNEELASNAPVLGGVALKELAPQLYRLLSAIKDENGHSWQISEANKLLMKDAWIRRACNVFGKDVGDAKWYFEEMHFSPDVTPRERELRSFTLRNVLGVLESKPIRARVGYHTPAWTPQNAIDNGQIVLISGERLINQEAAMGVLFTDVYTQILSVINKRTPHAPENNPVLMVIDEVPMLLEIKGMAEEISKVSPRYRSRNLQIMVIIQMLSQLDEDLRRKIWSLGNVAIFGIDNHKEAYEIAQQLFTYDPVASRTPKGMDKPVTDTDRPQYLVEANWIQHLKHRELILKRWLDEGNEEKYVHHIEQTTDLSQPPLPLPLNELKENLLKRYAISVDLASAVVNARIAKGTNILTKNRPDLD
jgi:hypothetical protein